MISRELSTYSLEALRVIASWQGIENVDQSAKAPLVQRLSIHLTRPENVARSLNVLLPHHRVTLERLQVHGGTWATGALGRDLRRAGYLEATTGSAERSGSPDRVESRRLEDVLAHLAVRGLVLTADFEGYQREATDLADPGTTAFIPSDVLPLLPPPRPTGSPVEVPRAAQADLGTTLRDALLYWSYAERNDVQIIARGTVAKRHLVRIAQSLLAPEDVESIQAEEALGRIHFLRLVLQEAQILKVAGGRLQAGRRALLFFGLSDWDQSRALYSAWLEGSGWNELNRLHELEVGHRGGPAPVVMAAGRKLIAQLVGESAPNVWVGLDELLSGVRRDHYQFLIPRRVRHGRVENPYTSHSRNPLDVWFAFDDPLDESSGWEIVEAELIVQFLYALHWLGLLVLGYDGDRLIAFQLTAAGRALIRGEASVGERQGKSLVVQASFQIIAYQHAPTSVLAALEAFAERVQAGPVFEYRLTRETAYRARRNGFAEGQILDVLATHSATAVPQNVRHSLLDWEWEQRRIVFRPAVTVLHGLDPARLDALLAAEDVAQSLGRRLAPDVLALRPNAPADELVMALARRGELLAVDRADEPPSPSVEVTADGRIAFGDRLPSLQLRRKLAVFAEEREGCYWVTASSLHRAAESGLSADDVLTTLRAYARAPLPPAVERAIAAGTRRWGRVSIAAVTLVQVEGREILDRLLAEPSLRGILRRVEGQESIAVGRLEDAEALREALEALGIDPGSALR